MDAERCRCSMDRIVSFQRGQNPYTTATRALLQSRDSLSMATVVPCASCYGSSRVQPLGFFGRGPSGGYMSLLAHHGPRGTPPPTFAHHAPNMTLRQICHMLRLMRQIRHREAAAAAAATRKQATGLAAPSSPSEKRCLPAFLRRRRTNNIKRVS